MYLQDFLNYDILVLTNIAYTSVVVFLFCLGGTAAARGVVLKPKIVSKVSFE
jgi:hypothetical protein